MFAKLVLPPCAPADISAQRKFVICRDFAANISSVWLFIWIKKWDSKNFWLKQTAAKFSANIIGCCSICLWEFFSCGSSWAPTPTGLCENSCLRDFNLRVFLKRCLAKWENICRVPRQITNFHCVEISGGGGGEKPDLSRSENVALCLFTSKTMAALRWSSSPREQVYYGKNNKV